MKRNFDRARQVEVGSENQTRNGGESFLKSKSKVKSNRSMDAGAIDDLRVKREARVRLRNMRSERAFARLARAHGFGGRV